MDSTFSVSQIMFRMTFLGLLQEADRRNLYLVVLEDHGMEIKVKDESESLSDPWRYGQLCEGRQAQGCLSQPVLKISKL